MVFKLDNSTYKVGDEVFVISQHINYISGYTERTENGKISEIGKTVIKVIIGDDSHPTSFHYSKTKVMKAKKYGFSYFLFKNKQEYEDYAENKRLLEVVSDLKEIKVYAKDTERYINRLNVANKSLTSDKTGRIKLMLEELRSDVKDML